MKILVCLSNVPDTTTKVKFVENNTKLDTTGIQWVINPWDELSLTRALELKDDTSTGVTTVTVAHVGGAGSEPTIRKALAIGADDAIRIDTEPTEAFFVASQLAGALKDSDYDIIMTGIESSDYNGSTVGGMLAELLDITSVSAVSALNIQDGKPVVTREIDGGRESLSVPLPVVLTVQKGIAGEPRIASMRGIMMSRSKPINVVEALDAGNMTRFEKFEMPEARATCKYVDADDPAQLLSLLQNEAKVL